MVSQLQTLSQSLSDQTVAYIAQLGITKDTKQTLQQMAAGTTSIPIVTESQVDSGMKVRFMIFHFLNIIRLLTTFYLVQLIGTHLLLKLTLLQLLFLLELPVWGQNIVFTPRILIWPMELI